MSVVYSFSNNLMSSATVMDKIAARIQSAAKQSRSVCEAGGGAIVVEIVPIAKIPHEVHDWLNTCYESGGVTISRAYNLLPFKGRYVTEQGKVVDCESVARGKIAALRRIRMDNPEEHTSFEATDLPGGADCGYIALHGAITFVVTDKNENALMEIYVAVKGSPLDIEDQTLAMKAEDTLCETLVDLFNCRLIGPA